MKRLLVPGLGLAGLLLAAPVAAQQAPAHGPLAVGTMAPDFVLRGATKDSLNPAVRLSDFRDQTVVIAFFFKARTKG